MPLAVRVVDRIQDQADYTGTPSDGQALVWVSADSKFEPTTLTAAPSGANPSASVGLTAVNGSASTFMRSDGASALSQTIIPTMTGSWIFAKTAGTGTQNPTITVTGPAHTALTASTESIDVNLNFARTVQFATGALTTQRAMVVQSPTYTAVGATTITTASTLAITAAPTASTNVTITNPYAFWVQAGIAEFDGAMAFNATISTAPFTSPAGDSIPARFVMAPVALGTNGQLFAFGFTSGASTSARTMSIFDNRAGTHYPTFAVWNPGDGDVWGPSWEGTNTDVYLKTISTSNIWVRVNNTTDIAKFSATTQNLLVPASAAGVFAIVAQGAASRTSAIMQLQTSAGASLGNVGGTVFNSFTDTSTTHTDGTEDDLYSYTMAANTLAINGDSIHQIEHVQFVASATAARRLKKYFAGTLIFDSGALTLTLGGDFWLETTIIRESSTIVRVSVNVVTTSASSVPYATYTRITGLTLTATNILKTTGIASGTGAGVSDIVNKLSKVFNRPAA